MSVLRKISIGLAAGITVIVLGWVVLIGGLYAWSGVATVRINSSGDGPNLYLPLPAAAAELAATGASWVMPAEVRVELERELGDWSPFLRELMRGVTESPDAVWVEVLDHETVVRIVKRDGRFRITVREPSINIEIAVPVRAVSRVAEALFG